MSRTIALLGLAQTAAVICGFFGLAIILRHQGYPDEPNWFSTGLVTYHWSHLTLFLRRFGLVLLVVPWGWMILAVISERRAKLILPAEAWLMVGTILPVVIVLTFFHSIFHPCVELPR